VYLLNKRNEDPNLLGRTTVLQHQKPANGTIPSSTRPKAGSVAYPFKLASPDRDLANPSMLTLKSEAGVVEKVKGAADGPPSQKVVDGGQVVSAERPEPRTFVTAEDGLNQARSE
jgi:hypothetical protein